MDSTGTSTVDLGIAVNSNAPAPPLSDAAAARIELTALMENKDWSAKHLSGSHETKAQVEALAARIAARPAGWTMHGGATLETQRSEMADHLAQSDLALSAAVIKQVRNGEGETAATHAEAARMKRGLLADREFRDAYLRGDFEARQKLTLLDIVISSPVAKDK
jgi:hypothetical protein